MTVNEWIIDKFGFLVSRKCINFNYRNWILECKSIIIVYFLLYIAKKIKISVSHMRFNIRQGDKFRNPRDLKPYLDAVIIVADYSPLNHAYVFTFSTQVCPFCTYRRQMASLSFLSTIAWSFVVNNN